MTFLADKIPMWLTLTLATIGMMCVTTGVILIAAFFVHEHRERLEANEIRRMRLGDPVDRSARWQ